MGKLTISTYELKNKNLAILSRIIMMKRMFYLGYVFIAMLLCACTSYKYGTDGPSQKSNLTYGVVKSKLIKGNTTQTEVLELFGAPNLISKNRSNSEVWSYNKMSVEQKAGSTDFFSGQRASQSSSTRSFDLIITFTDDDIIEDYSVISTTY